MDSLSNKKIDSLFNNQLRQNAKTALKYTEISLIKQEELENKVESCTIFFVMRHAPTKNDHFVHGIELDTGISPAHNEKLRSFMQLKISIPFEKLYSGNSLRASETADLLGESKCVRLHYFDEQKLGHLEGMKKTDAFKHQSFEKMSKCIDYRIPAGANKKVGETGREVIDRILTGVSKIVSENAGKTVGICMSQCAINWLYRYLSNNFETIIHVKNYDIILFKYYHTTNTFKLLTPNGSVSAKKAIKIYNQEILDKQ
ncbi:MAG: histidine phosphatase family protein [Holosporaceae bacterium]|jgi:broad specificity phosphatase PhoE|nr:histidine phosphatase family protein [Holosporaceae bacterium]